MFLCKLAEQAENFNDMFGYLKEMIVLRVTTGSEFETEERNLMSVGFRNYVGQLQTSIRVLSAIQKTAEYRKYGNRLPEMKMKYQLKVHEQCNEITNLLKKAYEVCTNDESQCFIQKLLGDYYRYMYEALDIRQFQEPVKQPKEKHKDKDKEKEKEADEEKQMIPEEALISDNQLKQYKKDQDELKFKALKAYSYATVKAEKSILSSHPTRLALALNYSIF